MRERELDRLIRFAKRCINREVPIPVDIAARIGALGGDLGALEGRKDCNGL